MEKELISIIVPIYKVEKYLRECIDSIIGQDHKNLEIILVDDGSPDNCGAICDEYKEKDKRIKVIHKENGGLSSARNAGLAIATGRYIGFIDSDDYIERRMFSTLYDVLIKSDADVSMCDLRHVYKDGAVKESDPLKVEETINNLEAIKRMYLSQRERFIITVNKLYKKDILGDKPFIEGIVSEDDYFSFETFKKIRKVAIVNKIFYNYRINSSSIMQTKQVELSLMVLNNNLIRTEYFKKHELKELLELNYEEMLSSYLETKKYKNSFNNKQIAEYRNYKKQFFNDFFSYKENITVKNAMKIMLSNIYSLYREKKRLKRKKAQRA